MNQFVTQLSEEVHESLKQINEGRGQMRDKARECIGILEKAFENLKDFTSSYRFEDELEEIKFFKEMKPRLFCHLIYYRKVYNIEAFRPKGENEEQTIYLKKELRRINDFFLKNSDFHHYCTSGYTHMDKVYFLRGKTDIILNLESFYFERDSEFSTNCDFKITKMLANDMLESYLKKELRKLEVSSTQDDFECPKEKLSWTASKIDLIELIYALKHSDCFDNGHASKNKIVRYFEEVFNMELAMNVSRDFNDIRIRKRQKSFLERLKEKLDAYIDKLDSY